MSKLTEEEIRKIIREELETFKAALIEVVNAVLQKADKYP